MADFTVEATANSTSAYWRVTHAGNIFGVYVWAQQGHRYLIREGDEAHVFEELDAALQAAQDILRARHAASLLRMASVGDGGIPVTYAGRFILQSPGILGGPVYELEGLGSFYYRSSQAGWVAQPRHGAQRAFPALCEVLEHLVQLDEATQRAFRANR